MIARIKAVLGLLALGCISSLILAIHFSHEEHKAKLEKMTCETVQSSNGDLHFVKCENSREVCYSSSVDKGYFDCEAK